MKDSKMMVIELISASVDGGPRSYVGPIFFFLSISSSLVNLRLHTEISFIHCLEEL